MAQTFQVLKCYQCCTFQVQIKKKSSRWACKLCGEKQSLIKIYAEGCSKDCRIHVQKLNSMRGYQEELKRTQYESVGTIERESPERYSPEHSEDDLPEHASRNPPSKWAVYVDGDTSNKSRGALESGSQPPNTVPPIVVTKKKSKWTAYVEEDSASGSNSFQECDELEDVKPSKRTAHVGDESRNKSKRTRDRDSVKVKPSKWANYLENQPEDESGDAQESYETEVGTSRHRHRSPDNRMHRRHIMTSGELIDQHRDGTSSASKSPPLPPADMQITDPKGSEHPSSSSKEFRESTDSSRRPTMKTNRSECNPCETGNTRDLFCATEIEKLDEILEL